MIMLGLADTEAFFRFSDALSCVSAECQTAMSRVSDLPPADAFDMLRVRCGMPESMLLDVVQQTLGLPVSAAGFSDPGTRMAFEEAAMRSGRWLPLYRTPAEIVIAVDNPFNQKWEPHINEPVRRVLWSQMDLTAALYAPDEPQDAVHKVIYEAIVGGASDVHVLWTPSGGVVRFRQNGQLSVRIHIAKHEIEGWIRILKLLAHLDPGRGLMPQDGQLSVRCGGKAYDVRVSTLPTVRGEDAVLRLFDTNQTQASLADLGFWPPAEVLVGQMLAQRCGVILVTGPTGSGKTTTLYTLIRELAAQNLSVVTLEDPVEQHLAHVRQSQVNAQSGYTFSNGLKYLLRQDPDVVMVGEIRDPEGAKMAFDAAYTGHLVLSSLHTDSVRSTFARLSGFGLDPFLIRYALKGIISQQLASVRCCEPGCAQCQYTGYRHRRLLTEVLMLPVGGQDIEALIQNGGPGYHAFETDLRLKELA
jgi:type II secretory ATPase GspE/PulE/Tfp pilus assembly ATPase PilB-like protein